MGTDRGLGENPLDLLVPKTGAGTDEEKPTADSARGDSGRGSANEKARPQTPRLGAGSSAAEPAPRAPSSQERKGGSEPTPESQRDVRAEPGQYLSFFMCDEEYCADIRRVAEIVRLGTLTAVPRTPNFVSGVMNLRGSVVPVVDLRVKFELGPAEVGPRTSVVIVEAELDSEKLVIGLLVDGANRVEEFTEDELRPPPAFGSLIHLDYLLAVAQREDDFLLVLDIDRILSPSELVAVGRTERLEAPVPASPEDPDAESPKSEKQPAEESPQDADD